MNNHIQKVFIAILGLVFGLNMNFAQTSILWQDFIAAKANDTVPILPDFSYAGYKNGEVKLPGPKHDTFNVVNYGAIANDGLSDKAAIVAAINAASANGSGIVFFPPGRFRVNEKTDDVNQKILIKSDSIIMLGSGRAEGGTEIYMTENMDPTDPTKLWTTPYLFNFEGPYSNTKITTVTSNAKRETFSIDVADASNIEVGQYVNLKVKDSHAALITQEMSPYPINSAYTDLNGGVEVNDIHLVTAISGNTLTFKEPIIYEVNIAYNWAIYAYTNIHEIGVEDIHFVGNFKDDFIHHADADHDGGYSCLNFSRTLNSWIKNCRFSNMNRSAQFTISAYCSVINVDLEGNLGHNAISVGHSNRIFIGASNDNAGNFHSFGVYGRSIGTVFWRNIWADHTSFESHASQPRYTLFDKITGGFRDARWGGAVSEQPNHLRGLILWNYNNTNPEAVTNFEFWNTDGVYGKVIPPIIVGMHGNPVSFVESQIDVLESYGTPVDPESLYEEQLKLRLGGSLPDWLCQLKGNCDAVKSFSLNISTEGEGLTEKAPNTLLHPKDSLVTIAATGTHGYVFREWVGDTSSIANPLILTVDTSKNIVARFTLFGDKILRTETFENYTVEDWQDTTYIGDYSIKWNVEGKKTSHLSSGTSVSIIKGTGKIYSDSIDGGISAFSVSCIDKSDDGIERKTKLFFNGEATDSITHTGTEVYVFEVRDLEIKGKFVIEIRNGSKEGDSCVIAYDNISWTNFDGGFKLNTASENGSVILDPDLSIFEEGSTVNLLAEASPTFVFDSWDGDLSGTENPTSIIMDNNKSVIANFVASTQNQTFTETFENYTIEGWQNITYVGDNGITWRVNGKKAGHLGSGTSVYFVNKGGGGLTSETINGGISGFSVECIDKWSDGEERTIELYINDKLIATKKHTGTEKYTFNVNDINIAGAFTLYLKNASANADAALAIDNLSWTSWVHGAKYKLTYDAKNGSIELTPDKPEYEANTVVSITAVPDANYIFVDWSGDLSGNSATETIVMDDHKSITANFKEGSSGTLNNIDKNKIVIYPNPAFGEVTINTQELGAGVLKIYNDLGQESFSTSVSEYQANVVVHNLEKGIYVAQYVSSKYTSTNMFVVR